MDVDDVGVIHTVGRPCLAEHPGPEVRFTPEIGTDELDRYDSVDEDVPGTVDNAHAAFANARF